MYCMPKVGTTVSLYFPSHDEKEAYAVNCGRKIAAEKESMFQEKDKTFLTEKGKLMALAPSAVHMCSMSEQSESYAQMSLVDTMQENAAVEDIVEKMGIMFAGNQNITLAASDILLDSLYGFVCRRKYTNNDRRCRCRSEGRHIDGSGSRIF